MNHDRGVQLHVTPNRPLYSQAAEVLVRYLEEQQYKSGAMLPGEDELARQLHVSRSTLREAMGILEREGRVVRKQGVGTFVTNPDAARFTFGLHQLVPLRVLAGQAGSELEVDREVTTEAPQDDLKALFKLGENDVMLRVRALLRIDICSISFYDYLIPLSSIDSEGFVQSGLSVLEYCLEYGRPSIAYAHSELHAVNVDLELAERLRLPIGAAVLRMVETFYSEGDEPVMRADAYHVTQRLSFRIIRQVPKVPISYRKERLSPKRAGKTNRT